MNKLTALIDAAKVANAFCNKCGYMGPDEPTHQDCDYMAKRTAVVPADTILELCALLEKAEEALKGAEGATAYASHDDSVGYRVCCQVQSYKPHEKWCKLNEALDAIKQWKEQT